MALLSHTLWKSLCGVDKDSSVTYINIIHFTSEIPRQFYVQRGYTCTSVVKNSLYYKLAAIYIHIRENKFYFYPRCRAPRERWVVYAQQRAPRTEKQKKNEIAYTNVIVYIADKIWQNPERKHYANARRTFPFCTRVSAFGQRYVWM